MLECGYIDGKELRGRINAKILRRRKIHIACLQETRWNGTKARELGEGYKFFYSGSPNRRNGVRILQGQGGGSQIMRQVNVGEDCRSRRPPNRYVRVCSSN
ncbi:unnamed protein product [Gordionus sp. m RMFG-2023]